MFLNFHRAGDSPDPDLDDTTPVHTVAEMILKSDEAQQMFVNTFLPDARKDLEDFLDITPKSLKNFVAVFSPGGRPPRNRFNNAQVMELQQLLRDRTAAESQHRRNRAFLQDTLRISPKFNATDFLKQIKVHYIEPFSPSDYYPPFHHWVYEDITHKRRWTSWLATNPRKPDKRGKSWEYPLFFVNPEAGKNRLNLDIGPSDSALIYDLNTGELVMVILSDFVRDPAILAWMSEVIERGCMGMRSNRLEDPGHLPNVGYTAGSRSKSLLGWTSTLATGPMGRAFANRATGELEKFEADISNVFALFWNICKRSLPAHILDEYTKIIAEAGLPRMDANGQNPFYEIPHPTLGTHRFRLTDPPSTSDARIHTELAPPGGQLAKNYCRYIHHERNLTKYILSFTTYRSVPPSHGGNFFNSKYGIRVQAGSNRLVVWKPSDYHGTSLQDLDYGEKDPNNFKQLGLATAIGARMRKAAKNYRDGILYIEGEEEI